MHKKQSDYLEIQRLKVTYFSRLCKCFDFDRNQYSKSCESLNLALFSIKTIFNFWHQFSYFIDLGRNPGESPDIDEYQKVGRDPCLEY